MKEQTIEIRTRVGWQRGGKSCTRELEGGSVIMDASRGGTHACRFTKKREIVHA